MVASFFTNVTKFTATSGGTGSFAVSAAVTGYQTPATATAVSNATYSYRAESADLTQWEVGTGVYTSSNVTLTRSPTINSAGGSSAINFTLAPQVGLVVLTPDIVRPYYFSASLSSNQTSTATGVSFKVNCNTELADSNGWYDNATNFRFTPQFAGKYRISGQVSFSASTNMTQMFVDITKNSTSNSYARSLVILAAAATVTFYAVPISIVVDFNGSTDFVEMTANVAGTGTLEFLGGSGPIRTFFEAQYIGV
jgi:hypothetical protein